MYHFSRFSDSIVNIGNYSKCVINIASVVGSEVVVVVTAVAVAVVVLV